MKQDSSDGSLLRYTRFFRLLAVRCHDLATRGRFRAPARSGRAAQRLARQFFGPGLKVVIRNSSHCLDGLNDGARRGCPNLPLSAPGVTRVCSFSRYFTFRNCSFGAKPRAKNKNTLLKMENKKITIVCSIKPRGGTRCPHSSMSSSEDEAGPAGELIYRCDVM